jgi:hypothetical protein
MKRMTAILGALCLGGVIAATSVTHAAAFDAAPAAQPRQSSTTATATTAQQLFIQAADRIMPIPTEKVCFGGTIGRSAPAVEAMLDLPAR